MVKVVVKTLTGAQFDLELSEDETVLAVKERLAAQQNCDVDSQKLIYQGKILANDSQIKTYGIQDGGLLVMMVTKPAKKAEAAAAPAPSPAAAAPAPAPAPATEAKPEYPDAVVAQLTDMGFARDDCLAALRAANGNADRAVEYLMNGLPDTDAMAMDEDGAEVEDMDDDGEDDYLADNPLAFLLQTEDFHRMRAMVQQNPALLEPLLKALGQAQPDILRTINENQDAFLDLINDTGMGGGGGGGDGMVTIQVTPEENEAIERLCALGFTREQVIEAYLACDKNETMAANYLFDASNFD